LEGKRKEEMHMKHSLHAEHFNVLSFFFIGAFLLLLGTGPQVLGQTKTDMAPAKQQDVGRGYALVLDLGAVQTSWMRASAQLELVMRIGVQTIHIPKLSLRMEDIHILVDKKWTPIQSVTVHAGARIDLQSGNIAMDNIRCILGSKLIAQGHFQHGNQRGEGTFAVYGQAAGRVLAPLLPWLSKIQAEDSGTFVLDTHMAWAIGDADQGSFVHLTVHSSQPVHWQQSMPDTKLSLPPLRVSIKGNLSSKDMRWTVQATEDVRLGKIVAAKPQAQGRMQFASSGIRIPRAVLDSQGIRRLGVQDHEQAVHIEVEDLSAGSQGFALDQGRVDIQNLGIIGFSSTWADPGESILEAQGSDLKVPGLLSMLRATGLDWVPGWSIQGRSDIYIKARKRNKGVQASWDMSLKGLGGTSPDQQIMAAGLTGRMQGSVNWQSLLQADLSLQMDKGEVLWGSWYADLKQAPVSFQAKNEICFGQRVEVTDLQMQVGQILHLQGRAGFPLGSAHPHWKVAITKSRLHFSALCSVVQGLLPDDWIPAGQMAWSGTLRDTEYGPCVQGVLQGQGLGLALPQGQASLDQWEFTLPVEYTMGKRVENDIDAHQSSAWGTLRPGRLVLLGREIHVDSSRIRLTENNLEIKETFEISGMGSRLQIDAFRFDLPWNRIWRAEGTLDIISLHPARLVDVVPDNAAELFGKLEFLATAQEIQTKGQLQGTVFGGNLLIDELGGKRPLKPSRMLTANAHISDLDLKILSKSLGIGRITGKMRIDLNRLGVAYGQPVRFHLRAESVPEPEVERRISLQAVNSLSIIGTGQGLSGLGIRLYASFFEQFPYQRIGVSCVLANDVFSLNGLIREDGVEYIVKRGWTGINVINTNPNNMIAFSDMLDRLERVLTQTEN
jgi:hypothetical protein